MKKMLFFIAPILIFTIFIISNSSLAADESKKVRIIIGGSLAGGGSHLRSEGVAEAIRRTFPNYDVNVITGSHAGQVVQMIEGKVDILGEGSLSHMQDAANAVPPFNRPFKIDKVRSIMATGTLPMHIILLKKTGVNSLKEIKSKKLGIRITAGQVGSAPYSFGRIVLNAYGINFKDIESWGGKIHFVGSGEGSGLIRDGLADGFIRGTVVPNPNLVDLGKSRELALLPVDEDVIKALEKSGFRRTVIPAGSYPFAEKAVPSVTDPVMILCRADLPDETVYNVTKAIVEQGEYLGTVHKMFKMITPKLRVDVGIPLHPGAERYYREKGFLK